MVGCGILCGVVVQSGGALLVLGRVGWVCGFFCVVCVCCVVVFVVWLELRAVGTPPSSLNQSNSMQLQMKIDPLHATCERFSSLQKYPSFLHHTTTMQTPNSSPQDLLVRTVTPVLPPKQLESVQTTDQHMHQLIQVANDLTDVSKAHYRGALRRLVGTSTALIPNKSLLWCITHPDQTAQLLCTELRRRNKYSPYTINAYFLALRAVMARDCYLKKKTELREQWTQLTNELATKPLLEHAKSNLPTSRLLKGYVPYPQLQSKYQSLYDSLKDANITQAHRQDLSDALLLGLVASGEQGLLPQRVDYGDTRIYINSQPQEPDQGNYVILTTRTGRIVLNDYKTSKRYHQLAMDMPAQLVKILLMSLTSEPRSWLFTKRRGPPNIPYDKSNAFGKYCASRFKALFGGTPLTLGGVRHSCITHMHTSPKWAHMSDAEREAMALAMGHSFATACRYRFVAHALPLS